MKWSFEWHAAALHGLRNLPWRTAARLDGALIRFAETGIGNVRAVSPARINVFEIRVTGAVAVFIADQSADTLHVVSVFARS
jgi:hypothetical protein